MKNFIFILVALGFSFSVFAEDSKYCNGQIMKDTWGSYYPNGQKKADHWGAYFPNGHLTKDDRSVYFPNGQFVEDTWGTYYPNRQKTKDSWNVYYHNGQVVKNSWGCYFSNGQKMHPCQEIVDARMWLSQSLVMEYKLNTSTGQISDLKFEEYVQGTRTLYELSLIDGSISNLEVFCDKKIQN